MRLMFRVLLRCRIEGIDNVPPRGRLIVIMNHINFLDPILVTVAFPRDIAIMSKIENLQMPVLGKVVEWYGSFPVRRGELDVGAVKMSMGVLENECALLLAPEGTRSKDAGLQPAFDGMALVATRTNSPVLPVAISGVESFSSRVRQLRRTSVTLAFGEPFAFVHENRRVNRAELREMTSEAMRRISALLPESYRGLYPDPEKDAMRVTASYTGNMISTREPDLAQEAPLKYRGQPVDRRPRPRNAAPLVGWEIR